MRTLARLKLQSSVDLYFLDCMTADDLSPTFYKSIVMVVLLLDKCTLWRSFVLPRVSLSVKVRTPLVVGEAWKHSLLRIYAVALIISH